METKSQKKMKRNKRAVCFQNKILTKPNKDASRKGSAEDMFST